MKLMRDLVGATFSHRYRLVARIAGGGMGEVYRGHDLLLDRAVAVKVLQPGLAADPDLVERFKEEARAAARLTHPNVVGVYDWGEEDDRTYYMVMEYVPGTDLRDVLVSRGAIEPAQAAAIVADVCDALSAAHSTGLVHRDVKPENVLIAPGGKVKVADFGIAAVAGRDGTAPDGVIPGTLRYIAPEQARGAQAGPAADVWAAGALLYELLTGTPPHQGTGAELLRRRATEPLAPPSEAVATVPAALDEIVRRSCALDPADRWRDAADMADALRRETVRSLPDAPSLDALLDDVTGEIRLLDMEPTSLSGRRERRRKAPSVARRRLGALLVGALLLLGGAKAVGAFLAPRAVKVPSLTGMARGRAVKRAAAVGLDVAIAGHRRDTQVPKGAVLSQRPDSGVLKQGARISVVLSAGPPRSAVPTLSGATLAAATVMLRTHNLAVGGVEHDYSTQPEGIVIDQSPADGKLPWGGKVSLVVSKGPEVLTVPSVAGLSLHDAKAALKAAGFGVATTTDYSDSVDEGLVAATSPAEGSAAPEGTTVTIVISAGPRYKELTMPDVRNMSVDSARSQLEGLGLRVKVIQSCSGGSTVVDSDPVAGRTVKQHDVVALFVC